MTRISGFHNFNFSSYGSSGINSIYGASRASRSSYAQLLRARYGQNTARNKLQTTSADLATVKGKAEDLTGAVVKLNPNGKNDLFEKKTIRQADGTTVMDYDKDAIYNAVNRFVDSYNDTLKNASVSTDRNVANAATSMSRTTQILSRSLAKVGITTGTDGKLSLDEKAFKNADMDTVKSLFHGSGSFADNVAYAAKRIDRAATSSLASMTTGIYGPNGYFGYGGYGALGNFFNGYF